MNEEEDRVVPQDGEAGTGEFAILDGGTAYQAVHDESIYGGEWQVSDPAMYIDPVTADISYGSEGGDSSVDHVAPDEGGSAGSAVQSQGGSGRPLTPVSSRNGQVGVRTNVSINFRGGGILVGGRASGTIPASLVVYGTDRNGNRIPDLLERCFRDDICSWSQ